MSESFPSTLRYTKEHEWARVEADGTVYVGITTHAVDQLGDITLVTVQSVGTRVKKGEHFGDIDSVKAVSELFSPLTGEIVETNARLVDAPEQINDDPYEGWMIRVRPTDPAELDELMSAEQYIKFVAEHG